MMVDVVTPGPRLKAPSLSLKAGSAGRCQETIPDHTIAQRAASPQAGESGRRSSLGDPVLRSRNRWSVPPSRL